MRTGSAATAATVGFFGVEASRRREAEGETPERRLLFRNFFRFFGADACFSARFRVNLSLTNKGETGFGGVRRVDGGAVSSGILRLDKLLALKGLS